MQPRLSARRGFTLIESLAAFAILTLVLGQLLQGVSGGTRNEGRADFLLRALRQGRSHLDQLGVVAPIAPGDTSGVYDDGLVWNLTVEPRGASKQLYPGGPSLAIFRAHLDIRRPYANLAPGDAYSLTTIKLISLPAAAPLR